MQAVINIHMNSYMHANTHNDAIFFQSSGVATRLCNANGEWEEANVLECTTIAFIELEQLVSVT